MGSQSEDSRLPSPLPRARFIALRSILVQMSGMLLLSLCPEGFSVTDLMWRGSESWVINKTHVGPREEGDEEICQIVILHKTQPAHSISAAGSSGQILILLPFLLLKDLVTK